MSGAVWKNAFTSINVSWDILLEKMFTILNDQGSVIVIITKAKWGVALKYHHKKRNVAKYDHRSKK